MKNRKLWLLLGGIVLVLVLALTPLMSGCAAPAEEPKPPVEEEKPPVEEEKPPEKVWELSYSTILPESHLASQAHFWVLDTIEERTNGRVLFTERYHTSQLFGPFDQLAGLSKGGVDLSLALALFAPAELDMAYGVSLPLFPDIALYLIAQTEMLRTHPALIEEATRNNIAFLSAELAAYYQLCSAEKNVTTAEDLAGMTLNVRGPLGLMLEPMGITPVNLSTQETYEAQERGLIDGYVGSLSDIHSFRIFEVSEYFIDLGLPPYNNTWATAMNLDTWNSLPPDIQLIIMDALDEATPYIFILQTEGDVSLAKDMVEAGIQFSQLPAADIEKIRATLPTVIDAWVDLKPEDEAARRQFIQDYLDIAERTTVPSDWLVYDPSVHFK